MKAGASLAPWVRIPPPPLFAALLAVALTGLFFVLQAHIGIQLSDEGYLWMGTIEMAHGAIPIRDFYSYDPGRYLWTAAWALLFGEGIVALRLSVAVFASIGLFCGLRSAQRVVRTRLGLVLVGLLLVLWLFPRHKLFESSIAMAGVLVGVRLLERPNIRRCFECGVMVGLATVVGKNHGLYLGFGFLVLLVFVRTRARDSELVLGRSVVALSAGLVIGLLPLLVMFAVVPGFASSYWEFIRYLIAQGRTNVPVPIPWPWRAETTGQFLLGVLFVAIPATALLLVVMAARRRGADSARSLAFVGGAIGSLYMHHAFSRAGSSHMAQSIHPVLLGAVGLRDLAGGMADRTLRAGVYVVVAVLTFTIAIPQSPVVQAARAEPPYQASSVAGDRLLLSPAAIEAIDGIRDAVDQTVPSDEALIVLPWYPGLYPILGRRPPVWDTYMVWIDRRGADRRMIREIERNGVRWMLVGWRRHYPFDFVGPHRTLAKYLSQRMERVPAELPRGFALFHLVSKSCVLTGRLQSVCTEESHSPA